MKRKRVARNLKFLALEKKQFTEDLLDLNNLYFVVSAILSLSCHCCGGQIESNTLSQLKKIGKTLRQEVIEKHHSGTQLTYFYAFLKLVNVDNSNVAHIFPFDVQKEADDLAKEYQNKKYPPQPEFKSS